MGKCVGGLPGRREPDGGERGGTLPTFKDNKAQRDEVKGWKEWPSESEHENWK